MGFLRKVGKKIKKGVSKLLGGKFGKILGGIGLAMMFWGGASALFGNQGWFQGLKTNLAKMNPFGSQSITQASEVAINSLPETTTGIDKLVGAGTDAAAQASAVSVDPTKYSLYSLSSVRHCHHQTYSTNWTKFIKNFTNFCNYALNTIFNLFKSFS